MDVSHRNEFYLLVIVVCLFEGKWIYITNSIPCYWLAFFFLRLVKKIAETSVVELLKSLIYLIKPLHWGCFLLIRMFSLLVQHSHYCFCFVFFLVWPLPCGFRRTEVWKWETNVDENKKKAETVNMWFTYWWFFRSPSSSVQLELDVLNKSCMFYHYIYTNDCNQFVISHPGLICSQNSLFSRFKKVHLHDVCKSVWFIVKSSAVTLCDLLVCLLELRTLNWHAGALT